MAVIFLLKMLVKYYIICATEGPSCRHICSNPQHATDRACLLFYIKFITLSRILFACETTPKNRMVDCVKLIVTVCCLQISSDLHSPLFPSPSIPAVGRSYHICCRVSSSRRLLMRAATIGHHLATGRRYNVI